MKSVSFSHLYKREDAEFSLLQGVLAGAGVGVWEYDVGIEIVKADERTAEMLGLSDEERLAAPLARFFDAIHPDDAASVRNATNPPDPFDLSFRVIRNGEEHWVRSIGRWGERQGTMLLLGITIDITLERSRQKRLELLAREMRHRVGNTFAILGGLVGFEAESADSAADLADRLRDRLVVLSQAQSLSFRDEAVCAETSIAGLISTVSKPFLTMAHGRFNADGPEMFLEGDATAVLSMILYEWMTNSLKYGALSTATGEIEISWSVEDAALRLFWQETATSIVDTSRESGFGERMQHEAIAQRGGSIHHEWLPNGLKIELLFPMLDEKRPTHAEPAFDQAR